MKRSRTAAVAGGIIVALAVAFSGSSSGEPAGSPFYLVPSPTKECANVSNCQAVSGPWVVVPAGGEASYLLGCPTRRAYIVAGTDARASSSDVRVWFDGQIGSNSGLPSGTSGHGAVLLFHALTDNGKAGAFQPILGCVSLKQESKRSTVSLQLTAASPGASPGKPLDLRATNLVLGAQTKRTTAVRCPANETLVGGWSAVALATSAPPAREYLTAVPTRTVIAHGKVRVVFQISGILLVPLAPMSWIQIGAMCEP